VGTEAGGDTMVGMEVGEEDTMVGMEAGEDTMGGTIEDTMAGVITHIGITHFTGELR
jgi:hypothetical protein